MVDIYLCRFPGPKFGSAFASTDNGFARFNRVRIPKENMLSGFAQVTDEGKYLQPPHAKLSYGGVRSVLVPHVSATNMIQRCFIFVRSEFPPEKVLMFSFLIFV